MNLIVALPLMFLFAPSSTMPPSRDVQCSTLLLSKESTAELVKVDADKELFRVQLTLNTGKILDCGLISPNLRPTIARWLRWKRQNKTLVVDDLIGWLSHPWVVLREASAHRLAVIAKYEKKRLGQHHLSNLKTTLLDSETSVRVASSVVKAISALPEPLADEALIEVLERGSETSVRSIAVRALSTILTPRSRRALERCEKSDERTLNVLCKHQLLRWRARRKAARTP